MPPYILSTYLIGLGGFNIFGMDYGYFLSIVAPYAIYALSSHLGGRRLVLARLAIISKQVSD